MQKNIVHIVMHASLADVRTKSPVPVCVCDKRSPVAVFRDAFKIPFKGVNFNSNQKYIYGTLYLSDKPPRG